MAQRRRQRRDASIPAHVSRRLSGHVTFVERSKRRDEQLMATLAAVDLGAQSGRVAVGRFDGERLSVSEVHRFPNVPVKTGDTLNWDILGLYQEVIDGLRCSRAGGRARRFRRRRLLGYRLRTR